VTPCWLVVGGDRLAITIHDTGPSPHGEVACECHACGSYPLMVQGHSMKVVEDRAYEATGIGVCCGAVAGVIRAEPSTLFGLEEDRAVLGGRCRVY
jgi:hypothetical protein